MSSSEEMERLRSLAKQVEDKGVAIAKMDITPQVAECLLQMNDDIDIQEDEIGAVITDILEKKDSIDSRIFLSPYFQMTHGQSLCSAIVKTGETVPGNVIIADFKAPDDAGEAAPVQPTS